MPDMHKTLKVLSASALSTLALPSHAVTGRQEGAPPSTLMNLAGTSGCAATSRGSAQSILSQLNKAELLCADDRALLAALITSKPEDWTNDQLLTNLSRMNRCSVYVGQSPDALPEYWVELDGQRRTLSSETLTQVRREFGRLGQRLVAKRLESTASEELRLCGPVEIDCAMTTGLILRVLQAATPRTSPLDTGRLVLDLGSPEKRTQAVFNRLVALEIGEFTTKSEFGMTLSVPFSFGGDHSKRDVCQWHIKKGGVSPNMSVTLFMGDDISTVELTSQFVRRSECALRSAELVHSGIATIGQRVPEVSHDQLLLKGDYALVLELLSLSRGERGAK